MDANDRTRRTGTPADGAASGTIPMCYYCSSTDTMEPFNRSDHVFLLSTLFPNLRARYCRNCTRHFLAIAPRPGR